MKNARKESTTYGHKTKKTKQSNENNHSCNLCAEESGNKLFLTGNLRMHVRFPAASIS